jgi:hypothetical protein
VIKTIGDFGAPCPYLEFENDNAVCKLAEVLCDLTPCYVGKALYSKETVLEMFGIGKGCCIKARAYKNGKEYDFASLPEAVKKVVVKERR